MAANGSKDAVAWDLDWDDLTEGAPVAPAAPPPTPVAITPAALLPNTAISDTRPPLPQRASPTPEPSPQRPPTSASTPPPLPTPAAVTPVAPPPEPARQETRPLVRGQRIKLADVLPGNPPPAFEVALVLAPPTGQTLDLCCFGLDEDGKLADDRYFIFFNQKSSPDGALNIRGTQGEVFGVDLARLPGTVRRLVFTANVDGAGSVRTLGTSRFELRAAGGSVAARYEFNGGELEEVKALMVAEIYSKDGVWRLGATGQGFAGGLSDLLKHFGGQEV